MTGVLRLRAPRSPQTCGPARAEPFAPEPVRAQQLVGGPISDQCGDGSLVAGVLSRGARRDVLHPPDPQTGPVQARRQARPVDQPDRVRVRHVGRGAGVSGSPTSTVNAKRPAGANPAATASNSVTLSAKASMVSSSSTTSKRPDGSGGTVATSKRQQRFPVRSRARAMARGLERPRRRRSPASR